MHHVWRNMTHRIGAVTWLEIVLFLDPFLPNLNNCLRQQKSQEAFKKINWDCITNCRSMGGLFSYFKGLFGSREMRILILGLDGAGKTTLLYRLQVLSKQNLIETFPNFLQLNDYIWYRLERWWQQSQLLDLMLNKLLIKIWNFKFGT